MNEDKGTKVVSAPYVGKCLLLLEDDEGLGSVYGSFSVYTERMDTYEILSLVAELITELFAHLEGVWPMDSAVMSHLLHETVIDTLHQRRMARTRSSVEGLPF